jgi:hypothetical protein
MTGYLRPQQQSEQRDGQPRPQVRPDSYDQPGVVELEDHRIGDRDAGNPRVADGHAGRALANDLPPNQVGQPAIDGAQQDSEIVPPAEHHPAGQRGDQLRIRCQRAHHAVDVVDPRRLAERGHRVLRRCHATNVTSSLSKSNGLF